MFSRRTYSNLAPNALQTCRKAVALLSGGLDSALAIHLVKRQEIDVTAVHFTSFFSCADASGPASPIHTLARQLDVPLVLRPKGKDFLQLIRNPVYGHGKNLNPCVDCRIYTLRKAKELMEEIGASFLVTGEVLGQRPMSQRRDAMGLIEKQSGCRGILLRPLSAKLLRPTLPEEAGIIRRDELLSLAGRGRKVQLGMAKELGLTGYSPPAGGCLLTDKNFSRRLRDLLDDAEDVTCEDLSLLQLGRHFRLRAGLKIVVGRNQAENHKLEGLSRTRALFTPADFPGPWIVAAGLPTHEEEIVIGSVLRRYAKESTRGERVAIRESGRGERVVTVTRLADEEWLLDHIL